LERETLDAADIALIIAGKELPPMKSALAYADGDDDTKQTVIKPEGGRKAGFGEGQTTTA
jgi:cell division protease FtsH